MPRHNFESPRGEIRHMRIQSRALQGNLLGDPCDRTVALYVSEEAVRDPSLRLPLMVDLTGYTGSGLKHLAWQPFGESVPQRVDRLVREGRMGPVVLAFPDCFTSLGGNQYIDSPVTGHWEAFLLDEMLPEIERRAPVVPGAASRCVFGKSSGGYGALIQGLRHGDRWAAIASLSGDVGFDLLFRGEFPKLLDALARHGGVTGFLDHFAGAKKIKGEEFHVLMMLAMAASYDPDVDAPKGIRLPVDERTCELIESRWNNWLRHDPLRIVDSAEALASLRVLRRIYLDCGARDQYHLQYGTRALVAKLEAAGIEHRYDEFDDDHSGIDYRMDEALPFLYGAVDR